MSLILVNNDQSNEVSRCTTIDRNLLNLNVMFDLIILPPCEKDILI